MSRISSLALFLALPSPALATTWSTADYAGADIVLADGDVLEGELTNVGLFHVPAGISVSVAPEVPLRVEAAEILVEGTVDGNAAGYQSVGLLGGGPGGGHGWWNWDFAGAGGAGHGGGGGHGCLVRCPATFFGRAGGARYGTPYDPLDAPLGSAGGFNSAPGGAGGGSVTFSAPLVTIAATASVAVDGGRGSDHLPTLLQFGGGGAGGGSGGSLVVEATTVQVDGVLSAVGGDGGDGQESVCGGGGGGGGGGGRVKIYGAFSGTLSGAEVDGGSGGVTEGTWNMPDPDFGGPGRRGTIFVDDLVATAAPTSAVVAAVGGGYDATVTGGTPWGSIEIHTGAGLGGDVLPGGMCAGAPSGLAAPVLHAHKVLDGSGAWATSGTPSDLSPGDTIVIVDLWSCTVGAPITLP